MLNTWWRWSLANPLQYQHFGNGVKMLGDKAMRRKMAAMAAKIPGAVGAALYSEGLIEMAESMMRTPVKTGALRASHETMPPEYTKGGTEISVTIKVGGPAAPYAKVVHEDMEALHRTGEAKFLENTIKESAPFISKRVAARLKVALV